MINNQTLGLGLQTISGGTDYYAQSPRSTAAAWLEIRNAWMREQGIGGVFRNGKKSKIIPDWWGAATLFWFIDSESETAFVLKWGSSTPLPTLT